jgi:hypothetical protein
MHLPQAPERESFAVVSFGPPTVTALLKTVHCPVQQRPVDFAIALQGQRA